MELKIGDKCSNFGGHIVIVNIVKDKLLEDKLTIKYCWDISKIGIIFDMPEDTYNSYISRGILIKV